MKFHVIWDNENCTDGFVVEDFEEAKYNCLEILYEWMNDFWFEHDINFDENNMPNPSQETIDEWDSMIFNCYTRIAISEEDFNGNIPDDYLDYDWEDGWADIWFPSYEDEKEIHWLEWEEFKKFFN